MKSLKLFCQSLLSVICAITISFSAHAAGVKVDTDRIPDESTLLFYAENNLFWYDPTGYVVGRYDSHGFCNDVAASQNYNGAAILDSNQMQAVVENQKFYEKSASDYGFPWQILATIHYKEYGLNRSNPANGQGVYQLYTYTNGGTNTNAFLPPGEISDEEFQRQTDIAAEFIASIAGDLDLNNPDNVKRLFFKYNGTSQRYIDKALAMGFSEEEARNGEGSPYVMNRYDEARDPSNPNNMSPNWPGMFIGDHNWSNTATNLTFGAYTVYESLGGNGTCGSLKSGGATSADDVLALLDTYLSTTCDPSYMNCAHGGVGGQLANCVTFVQWFIYNYTTAGSVAGKCGNGQYVVGNLVSLNVGFEFGSYPRPYAIFSEKPSNPNDAGHTGVILGVDEENGLVYVAQAAWGHEADWGKQYTTYPLERFMDSSRYSYAYTDNILKI